MNNPTQPTTPSLPDPDTLTSGQRIAAINQARNAVLKGETLSDEQLKYTVALIRSERALASSRSSAKKKAAAPVTMTLDDI